MKSVATISRPSIGAYGEVFATEDGRLLVVFHQLTVMKVKDIVELEKYRGLGGILYDFRIKWHKERPR